MSSSATFRKVKNSPVDLRIVKIHVGELFIIHVVSGISRRPGLR